MGLASDMLGFGLRVLAAVDGEVTGTLVQEGVSYAFTGGRVAGEGREPRNRTDVRSRLLEVMADAFTPAIEPRAKSHVLFTGDTATWAVLEAEPVAPGGTVVAWRLSLVDRVNRED